MAPPSHVFLDDEQRAARPTLVGRRRRPAERFAAHLRPLVERGEGTFTTAVAYLWATKR